MSRFPGSASADSWETWPEPSSPFYSDYYLVEPKLDGYRLSVVVDAEGVVSFHCRDEQVPDWAENLEHVADAVRALGLRGVMLDGEVMARTWNATSTLLRRHRKNMDAETRARTASELFLHVFDVIEIAAITEKQLPKRRKPARVYDVDFLARRARLERMLTAAGPALRVVPQFRVTTPGELDKLFGELVDIGFEGAMIKHPRAPYVLDRHSYWLKMKPVQTIELTVTGSEEGLGKHAGRLGALVCRDTAGNEIRVGTGFSDAQREWLWAHRTAVIGSEAEVKVQAGDVSVARHPAFLRFRLEKNLAAAGMP